MNNTELIVTMYKNDVSILKISKIIGVPELEIYECLYDNGFSHLKDRHYDRDKAICEKYVQGQMIIDLAHEYQINRHTVTDILRRNNVYKGNRFAKPNSPEKIERTQKMIELYQEGLSLQQVADRVGVCASTVNKTLKKMNVDTRPQHMKGHSKGTTKNRKHFFDINYFEKIDSEEKAYWLGFLFADGYVAYRGVVQIALKQNDKCQLEAFRKALGDETVKITLNRKTNSYGMFFSSVKMAEDLLKLGCMQKKSLKLEFPNEAQVPRNLIHHFMRGYFDGDGCITNTDTYSPQFSVLGTQAFLDEYEKIMLLNVKNKRKTKRVVRDTWNESTQQIMYTGRLRLIDIYSFLYKDASIYLDRKKEKFEELKRRLKTSSQKS